MGRLAVVYDACVMYPAPLRSFLMYLAVTDIYRACWTNEIHEEWMNNLIKNRPDISRQQLERTRDKMNENVRDCLVTDYEPLIETLRLPDDHDRHVLAAAIRAKADIILTFNLKDFPPGVLGPYGMEAQHPDQFLCRQFDLFPETVVMAARNQRARLKKPAQNVEEYLETLRRQQLPETVLKLRDYSQDL